MGSKRKIVIFGAFAILMTLAFINFYAPKRAVEQFADGWQYHIGDIPETSLNRLEEFKWENLDGVVAESESGMYTTEKRVIWLKKKFVAPEKWMEKIVSIEFEKIDGMFKGFVNGMFFCRSAEKFTSGFVLKHLGYRRENEIVLRIETDSNEPPSSIFRNVHLTFRNPISVMRDGVKITKISEKGDIAKVGINAIVENTLYEREKVDVYFDVRNSDNKSVAKKDTTIPVPPRSMSSCSMVFDLPSRKSYKVMVSLARGHKVFDETETSFEVD